MKRLHSHIVIFSHIPKTGGSTLRRVIDTQYKNPYIYRYNPENHEKWLKTYKLVRPHIKCIYGHVRYGVHKTIPKTSFYITFLRHPVERVLSAYYYIRSRPENRLHKRVKNMSLREYIFSKDQEMLTPLFNHQTRFLTGRNEPNLRLALKHMKNNYAVVGITEMYLESVFLMKKILGWESIHYSKENVNKKRPSKEQISADIIEEIKRNNHLDMKLYNFAKLTLQKRLQALPSASKVELSKFIKNFGCLKPKSAMKVNVLFRD
jgi:hypothetical protein